MEKIDLGFEYTQEEFLAVLYMLVETIPHLDIVDDINMVISGLKENFSNETIELLNKEAPLIEKYIINFLRESDE